MQRMCRRDKFIPENWGGAGIRFRERKAPVECVLFATSARN